MTLHGYGGGDADARRTVMLSRLAADVGKGLFAGAAGTAAMTVSSTVEARLRGRSDSSAPATAAEALLGVEPVDDDARQRLNNLVHWGYGTVWGGPEA